METISKVYTTLLAGGTSLRSRSSWAGHDLLPLAEARSQEIRHLLTHSFIQLMSFEPHTKPFVWGARALPAGRSLLSGDGGPG